MELGFAVAAKRSRDVSNLLRAARTGDVDYLVRLIREEDSLLLYEFRFSGAETPLHIASMCGHLPFVQEMLKVRKQIAYLLNGDSFTPLHLASGHGHLQIVLELLKVDPDLCTVRGGFESWIALHSAVANGRIDAVKALLSACPDSLETKTATGLTVFHLSVIKSQIGAFEFLMEHVKKVKKEHILNEKDDTHNTILHYAALKRQYEVMDRLVHDHVSKSHVLEINSKNKQGMTALDILIGPPFGLGSETRDLQILLLGAGAKIRDNVPTSYPNQFPPNKNSLLPTQESRCKKNPNNSKKRVQSDLEAQPLLGSLHYGQCQDNNRSDEWSRHVAYAGFFSLFVACAYVLLLYVCCPKCLDP